MVEKIIYVEGEDTCPYQNLAVEEYLLLHCAENECILYLWQNKNAVVVGRNQNIWKECLVDKLQEENGYAVRRLSGGGAVYHDLGNLNFTFLVRKENYNIDRQLRVILAAVKKLGIHAEKSGRNDLLADNHKFSGNAFYEQGDHCYHHGTLMVNVDLGKLTRYLTVSKEKLKSKGIDSVKARVINLAEYSPGITVEILKEKLLEAFEEVYGLKARVLKPDEFDREELDRRRERFASWDWIFGRRLDFQYELSNGFAWGQLILQLQVESGRIEDLDVFSDSMEPEVMEKIRECLKDAPYSKQAILRRLKNCQHAHKEELIIEEITKWLETIDL